MWKMWINNLMLKLKRGMKKFFKINVQNELSDSTSELVRNTYFLKKIINMYNV